MHESIFQSQASEEVESYHWRYFPFRVGEFEFKVFLNLWDSSVEISDERGLWLRILPGERWSICSQQRIEV